LNPLKKLAGQTAVYGLGTIVPRLLNYLLVPIYTRIFADDQYGIVTELYAYMAFLLVLLTYGMETSFFRHAEKMKNTKRVFSTSLISLFSTTVLFVVLIIAFIDPVAGIIRYEDHKNYIIIFSLIVAIDAITAIPFAYLRHQNKAFKFSIIKIINVGVNIGLNLFWLILCPRVAEANPDAFILQAYDAEIGVGYVFISNLISSIITLLLVSPEIIKIKPVLDIVLLKRMLKYALPLLIVGAAGMINEVSDKIIFKYLLHIPEGIENADEYAMGQLGIYGANYKVAVLMTLFIQMFRYAAEPFFFKQAKEDNARQVYADVMKYFVIFGLFIFLGVTLFIDLIKYFIGPDYWAGLFIVPIILVANLFLGIFYNLSVWYKLNDLTRFAAVIAITGAVVTIGLNLALVPQYSYEGAAWAHLACYFVMMVMSFFWGRKHFRIDYPLKQIFFYMIFAAALFFINGLLHSENAMLNYVFAFFCMIIFTLVVFLRERKYFSTPN